MSKSKSTAKTNWFSRFWQSGGRSAKLRSQREANRLRLEKLESRQLLAAILLEIPGVNGDAKAAGATSNDIELTSFNWGFKRQPSSPGTRATTADPLVVEELSFTKPGDSASNALYAQANFSPLNVSGSKLRIVDEGENPGKNLFSFDLTNARLTEFGVANGSSESGALSFSKINLTDTSTATNRIASWDLLTGSATSSPVAGPGNIDIGPNENPLNIETVLEIGGQKLLINSFEWGATTGATVGAAGKGKGLTFKMERGVDTGTAGLLGSAAKGTVFDKILITDRKEINGKNQIVMEWHLYNAFLTDFGLNMEDGENGDAPINSLGWSFSKIGVVEKQFRSDGKVAALSVGWDEQENKTFTQSGSNSVGVELQQSIKASQKVSFLNLDSGDQGRFLYETIDWSVSKPVTFSGGTASLETTSLGELNVTYPNSGQVVTPLLLNKLYTGSFFNKVEHKEENRIELLSPLNDWSVLPSGTGKGSILVSEFAISSKGLNDPQSSFKLTVPKMEEIFNDRSIPLITTANFDQVAKTSTGALSFGGQTVDTEFELVVTEAGAGVSEIPVLQASWGAEREASRDTAGTLATTAPALEEFEVKVPRGIHSPGLFMASARGTEIDNVSLVRYHMVGGIKTELYRWDMTKAIISKYSKDMVPIGVSPDQAFDTILLNPRTISLKTDAIDASGKDVGDVATGWDVAANKAFSLPGTTLGGFGVIPDGTNNTNVLQVDFPGANNNLAIASFEFNATLPVESTTSKGERPVGDPDLHDLVFSLAGRPNPRLLSEALTGTSLGSTTEKPTIRLPLTPSNPGYGFEFPSSVITGFTYSDAVDSVIAATKVSLDVPTSVNANFTPLAGQGTPTQSTWNLIDDTTTSTGFGNFVFPAAALPPVMLEIKEGTNRSQVAATSYSFGTEHIINQLVGKSGAPVPLAPRGTAAPEDFVVTIPLNNVTPGLLSAIAGKVAIPEMKVVEHGTNANTGLPTPVREWTLTNVLVEELNGEVDASTPGSFTLKLNPATATRTQTDPNAIPPTSFSQSLDFVAPPTSTAFPLIRGVSTSQPRVLDIPPQFIDQEKTSTLRYTSTVVSGAQLFDSVTLNSLNRLVLDYKAGQSGLAQIRVDATNSFGLVGSLLVDVAVDVDGVAAAPAGTNVTRATNEDGSYTITAADFGFTDPNDTPADLFTGVRISSLPLKGSLTLNNVPVTLNQTITLASLNAGQLRYAPLANENGNSYASFTFQVQDSGLLTGGGVNLDPTPNTFTFNITPVNDAPVMAAGSAFVTIPDIAEDAANPAGVPLSDLAPLISDMDAGDLKGIAVNFANQANGNWQYAIDGINFQNFGAVSSSAARLLPLETTRIRFVPNANFNTPVGNAGVELQFVAWDRSIGSVGGTIAVPSLGGRGGTTAFSESPGVYFQRVTPVNDAPTLSPANRALVNVNEDLLNPTGTTVTALVTGVTDPDAGALRGIAVQQVENVDGAWQYRLSGSTTWVALGGVSTAAARLLPSTARVRFVPTANFNGTRNMGFAAWDQTTGVAGGVADLTVPGSIGGTTAFSSTSAIAVQTVVAVNDTPTLTSPTVLTTLVNTPVTFSSATPSSFLQVADLDADGQQIQVAFSSTLGRFSIVTSPNVVITAGSNGTSAFTVLGTVEAINAALNGSFFTPTANLFGPATLRLTVNDLGNTGSGGARSITRTTNITVNPIDLEAPTVTNPTVITNGSFAVGETLQRVYRFSLDATTDLRVALSGLTSTANMFLIGPNGSLGQTATLGPANRTILATAAPAGNYVLAVVPNGGATNFDLAVSIAASSDDLIVNANALGTLDASRPTVLASDTVNGTGDRQDYYTFTTTTAGGWRANLSGLSDDYDMQLLNGNGVLLNSSVLPGTSFETIARSNLPAGTYFLRVFALPNRTFSAYNLSVTVAPNSDDSISRPFELGALDATTLPVVRRVAPSIGSNTNVQDYNRFVLTSPSDVRINLTGLSADIDIQLQDSFGRPIAFGSNGGNASENVLATGLAAGTYYVRVAPFQNAGSTYELSVAIDPLSDDLLSNAVSLGALSATVPTIQRTGNVNFTSDRTDYYSFTLGATTDVRVNLSGLSGDADIVLEDSFGRLITSSSQSGNSFENLIATGLVAGTYSIRVFTGSTTASTNYLLAVSQLTALDDLITNATVLGTLTSGTLPTLRTVGSVGGSDIQDYHRFSLTTAGNLRFSVSNMTADLDVELLDQFGQVIISGTQNGNTIERVLTPTLAVGTYYIRVFEKVGGGPLSNYILEITTDFNGDDIIGPRTNLGFLASTPLTSSGSVGGSADTQDYFSFTLTSTRNVRFQLTGLSADIDIQVFNEFGNLIGSGTNGGSTSEDITLNSLLAGVYYIRVLPFNTAVSNYSLSVTGL